jgi:hypothetical protein
MWVLIVLSWVTASNMGGGYQVSRVPQFTSQQTCEAAAAAIKAQREKNLQTLCRPQ